MLAVVEAREQGPGYQILVVFDQGSRDPSITYDKYLKQGGIDGLFRYEKCDWQITHHVCLPITHDANELMRV